MVRRRSFCIIQTLYRFFNCHKMNFLKYLERTLVIQHGTVVCSSFGKTFMKKLTKMQLQFTNKVKRIFRTLTTSKKKFGDFQPSFSRIRALSRYIYITCRFMVCMIPVFHTLFVFSAITPLFLQIALLPYETRLAVNLVFVHMVKI